MQAQLASSLSQVHSGIRLRGAAYIAIANAPDSFETPQLVQRVLNSETSEQDNLTFRTDRKYRTCGPSWMTDLSLLRRVGYRQFLPFNCLALLLLLIR